MESIKFRAWDKGHNKMSYKVNLYSLNNKGKIDKCQIDNKQIMNHIGFDCEVMQYIGLKDKAGIEIYESDVVDTYPYYKIQVKEKDRFQKVIFMYGTFNAEHSSFGWEGEDLINLENCEIIGNIYENPELIK